MPPEPRSRPNELWCADYKGEFMLADRRSSTTRSGQVVTHVVVTSCYLSVGSDTSILAEVVGFEYQHFSAGIATFPKSTHVRTHE